MLASQRVLFDDMLDYAGLFPPARLSLDESIRNYARYRREPEAWMLARFICPTSRLDELAPYVAELFHDGPPLRLSALGRGGETNTAFLENLRLDLEAVSRFRERQRAGVVLECLETRLPADVAESRHHRAAEKLLADAAGALGAAGLRTLPQFYELPHAGPCQPTANAVATVLAAQNSGAAFAPAPLAEAGIEPAQHGTAGLKLRCGGLEPAAFPSVEQVAMVIEESTRAGVPLKFTAGLHQPTRRLDPVLGVYVHGFLNVFAAGILAGALGREHHAIMAVVAEEDVRQFCFSEDFFGWNAAKVTVSEIEFARHHRVIGFGSCSFDEPREGLRGLRLI